jgi:hypothetical protein
MHTRGCRKHASKECQPADLMQSKVSSRLVASEGFASCMVSSCDVVFDKGASR